MRYFLSMMGYSSTCEFCRVVPLVSSTGRVGPFRSQRSGFARSGGRWLHPSGCEDNARSKVGQNAGGISLTCLWWWGGRKPRRHVVTCLWWGLHVVRIDLYPATCARDFYHCVILMRDWSACEPAMSRNFFAGSMSHCLLRLPVRFKPL